MDFGSFAILFRSLFVEGLSRPGGGVQPLLELLSSRLAASGGELFTRRGVKAVLRSEGRARGVLLESGEEVQAPLVFSSAGRLETAALSGLEPAQADERRLSFAEAVDYLSVDPKSLGWDTTLMFFSRQERFRYRQPEDLLDLESGVICLPGAYRHEGLEPPQPPSLRVTALASHARWAELRGEGDYRVSPAYGAAKEAWRPRLIRSALGQLPGGLEQLGGLSTVSDFFTPLTLERYTRHAGGAVYGSPHKMGTGESGVENLRLIGTDQGLLGIVGAMFSGLIAANSALGLGAER